MKTCTALLLPLVLAAGCESAGPQPVLGTLERDRVELAAEHTERLVEIRITEGDNVAAGDRIAGQATQRMDARVSAARAGLKRRQARLAELVRGPRTESIREARAALDRTAAELSRAGKEFQRIEQLQADGLASTSSLDAARAARDTAAAAQAEQRARLESLLEGTTLEELDQARAELQEAASRLEELEVDRERLNIVAPVAGRIESLPFEPGELVPAGAPVAVISTGPPYARVYLPQALRNRIRPGDEARVHLDGYPQPFPGKVRFVSTEAAFTPYFALTERDRGRLVYLTEIELTGNGLEALPSGIPAEIRFPDTD